MGNSNSLHRVIQQLKIVSLVIITSNRANMQTPYNAFLETKSRTKYFGAVWPSPTLPGGLGQFQANGWEHLRWREMISTLISTEIPLLRMDTTAQMKERTHLHLDCFLLKQFYTCNSKGLNSMTWTLKSNQKTNSSLKRKKGRIF